MSAATARLPLAEATALAWELVALLSPYCERIEVCGSIRRQRETIGDIELVAIPRLGEPSRDLFGALIAASEFSWLDHELASLIGEQVITKREPVRYGSKYKALVYRDFPVDLFIVSPPAQWGVIQLIRTGSADFTHRLVTPEEQGGWMPKGMYCQGGSLWRLGRAGAIALPTPEEIHVFTAINREYIDPDQREV